MNVELSNFKQIKCDKDDTGYQVQFTIDGRIPGVFNGLSGWGIYVKTPNGPNLPFYAKESSDYYPPMEKTFTCDIRVDESEIRVEGTKKVAKVTVTPFYSLWNDLGLSFLDSEAYTITINDGLLQFKDLIWDNYYYANDNVYGTLLAVVEVPSGQEVDLSAYESCGIWMTNNITGMEYYSDLQENGSMQFYIPLEIPRDEFEKDYDSFTATCDKILLSTYAVDKDGNITWNDERVADIVYDVPPSFTYTKASITGIQVIERDEDNRPKRYRTDYSYGMDIIGAFWISAVQYRFYSTVTYGWNGSTNWATVPMDASYSGNSAIEYDKDRNISHTEYTRMQLTDGSMLNSTNSLVFGGTPSNPTVYIGGKPSQAPAINVGRGEVKEVFTSPFEIVKEKAIIRNRITKSPEGR